LLKKKNVVAVVLVSHSFGYGLMDAYAMVKLARNWKTVPEQHKCEVSAPHTDK
jgi:furin